MAILYDGLWNVLNKRGITKTEFRKLVNISTVTLAKMSKNEPVSMSIIETICLTLNCRIEEIVKFEVKQREEKWGRVQENAIYLTRLFYLTEEYEEDKERVDFLYGYSIIADEGLERKKRWELSEYMRQGNIRIWEITSTIGGDILRAIIRAMEQKKKMGEFLEDSSAELHDNIRNKRKLNWRNVFLNAQITHFDQDYRPEIVLIPGMESALLIKGMQPLHAFGEEPLLSESLVCRCKRKLYFDENGNYDIDRMEAIYNFFRKEKFLINGMKDLCRIGDFEVFSPLMGKTRQEELFRIESQVEELDGIRKVLKGFKITVFDKHLSGSYMLGVTTYNAGSPTSFKMYDIVVDGQDVIRTVDLDESSTGAIVCIWDKTEEKRIQLIGYKQISVMRDMFMNIQIQERTATIEDKYTKKFQKTNGGKNKNSVNRNMERYSSMEIHSEDEGNDPWRREFKQVESDFEELYGKEIAESRFFAQGMEAHEEFLEWLKKELNRKKIKSIWIFDPYIDADSVTRILRSLKNTGVQMKIVTDANAPSRNQKDRISILQNACEQLEEFLENHFSFYAFNGSQCFLHDRILLLFNQNYIPVVYNMSNSLDNMGMHTPSIVCKLNRNSAKACAEYYLNLYQTEQDKGNVQILWEKESHSQRTYIINPSEEEQEIYLQRLMDFFNKKLSEQKLPVLCREKDRIIFPDALKCEEKKQMMKVLCEDAGDYWEEICHLCANIEYPVGTELEKNLEDYYSRQWGEKLQEGLMEEIYREKEEERQQKALKAYQQDDFRTILQKTGYLLKYPYDMWPDNRMSRQGQMALDIIIVKDFPRYQEILKQLAEKEGSWQALKQKRALICRLTCIMTEREALSEELAERCLESENQELLAIGMQWFIKHRKMGPVTAKVQDFSYCHEFFRAMVIALQIEDCQKGYRYDKAGKTETLENETFEKARDEFIKKMQEVKEAWVDHFSDTLTAEQLETEAYFKEIGTRSKEDVCDLAVMLYKTKKLSAAELENFLINCFLEKMEKDYKKEEGYWRIEDFQNGELFLSVLKEFGTETAGKKIVEKLISWEKKLVKILHDVFLYHKDYKKWKCFIDMLMWCCTMRILCQQFWETYTVWIQEDRNGQTRQKEIHGLLKKYHIILQEYSDAYRILCRIQQDINSRGAENIYQLKENF